MRRSALILLVFVMVSGSAFGATLNLNAAWIANTTPNMKEYRIYRTDVTRTLIATIPHPNTSCTFSVTVPDGSAGTLTFVLVAVDIDNNVSPDSAPAVYPYNLDTTLDTTPPAAPKGLLFVK